MRDKLITIVGMGPGVSYSTAKYFAEKGFKIAMIARNEQKLFDYKKEFESGGTEAFAYSADAGDENSLVKVFDVIRKNAGETDVLHYNSFAMRQSRPLDLKYEDCIKDFKVNVAGALLSSQLVLPSMLEKKSGCLFFTGGAFALEPMPAFTSLSIGKAGIRNLAFSLYADLKSKNIHAATVTINGFVKPGTKWDPDIISEAFWKLYEQKQGEFEREIII
ncbi:MAG TPA: SDR family NAD(P)-dependent oxidoreductase [Ignavibacteria bacterium]|nr:SDR family NAD(P)-dependent oxidoreductase [Ignavibacteria bacterium]HMR39587.1 SDR family NAD(P)-dependent oxidoreductase [Ignavibacteria bacterium]